MRGWIAIAVALGSTGCSGLLDLNGGYLHSFSRKRGGDGAGLNYDIGVGGPDAGGGMQIRTKFTGAVAEGGVGVHGYAISGGNLKTILPPSFDDALFVRAGADVLQVGRVEGHANVGTMCPFLDVGMIVPSPGVELSAGLAYDWRLSSAKNDLWAGVFLGFGFGASGHSD